MIAEAKVDFRSAEYSGSETVGTRSYYASDCFGFQRAIRQIYCDVDDYFLFLRYFSQMCNPRTVEVFVGSMHTKVVMQMMDCAARRVLADPTM